MSEAKQVASPVSYYLPHTFVTKDSEMLILLYSIIQIQYKFKKVCKIDKFLCQLSIKKN
jgi:hypothetical protein